MADTPKTPKEWAAKIDDELRDAGEVALFPSEVATVEHVIRQAMEQAAADMRERCSRSLEGGYVLVTEPSAPALVRRDERQEAIRALSLLPDSNDAALQSEREAGMDDDQM